MIIDLETFQFKINSLAIIIILKVNKSIKFIKYFIMVKIKIYNLFL